jgi:hypothetical protein
VSANGTGGGASSCGEERTGGAEAKIDAATYMMAGVSLIAAAIVRVDFCKSAA